MCNIISVPVYAAGISPHEMRYHFADISPVPSGGGRISLKKTDLKAVFFTGRRSGHLSSGKLNGQCRLPSGTDRYRLPAGALHSLSFVKPQGAAAEQIQLTPGPCLAHSIAVRSACRSSRAYAARRGCALACGSGCALAALAPSKKITPAACLGSRYFFCV